MTDWIPGMFYDVGGAAALFWPDQHPEHPDPALAQRWIVFDPWGGLEIIVDRDPREDFIGREIGMVPFLNLSDPNEAAARAVWAKIRDIATEATVDEMRLNHHAEGERP